MINPQDIKTFALDRTERGSEKSDAQMFWIDLLAALGIKEPTTFIKFEMPIDVDDHKCFIDGWIIPTKVLIEQKSRGIDLEKPARQSDGKFLTPFEQAKRYADARDYSERPKWIVLCNFVEMRIYNMNVYYRRREDIYKPNVVYINRLEHDAARLNFLIDPNDENVDPSIAVSKQATHLIKLVRDALEKQCVIINSQCVMENPSSNYALCITNYALNHFCVRLMFCLYADDAEIFAANQFTDYFRAASDRRQALSELFRVLDTPRDRRPKNLRAELAAFPYVDGDMFQNAAEQIPIINTAAVHYILSAAEFDWIDVDPPIFGAMFESILDDDERRADGMHYTSIENIHKVIDPLFMDALHAEFKTARRKTKAKRRNALEAFQLKLASLRFFDPACGSGNFLTETYISIRSLENEVIGALRALGVQCKILVSIENFYGIEINNFAVAVARTALWIAENRLMKRTESILKEKLEFLPLLRAANITEGNALRINWKELAPHGVNYIISNPPFVGYSFQTPDQKIDLQSIFLENKKLDYVACWFQKAADFMIGTETRAAFVSTNSIIQGEQAAPLWQKLFESVHIDFAHRPFKWISDSDYLTAVHCVVIGFSHAPNKLPKLIYEGEQMIEAKNINAYLIDAPNVLIGSRTKPLCKVPAMRNGSIPIDGDALKIEADELEDFIRQEPRAEKFIRKLIGGRELIHNEARYVLWLVEATADEIASMPLVAERVVAVRQFRLSSTRKATIKAAEFAHLFAERYPPTNSYIAVPRVSSERRKYIPIGFFDGETIATNQVLIIPEATVYHFGVLTSIVHMAWMRVVCGRLEVDYRYSAKIVYNNFPWCTPTAAQRRKIRRTAQRILDIRARYPECSLAFLYDESTMPDELRAAHLENDNAVLDAYGFDREISEAEIVSRLMAMYQELVSSSTTRA